MKSQMSLELKCSKADYIIDNSNSLEETKIQVKDLIENLQKITPSTLGIITLYMIVLLICCFLVFSLLWLSKIVL